MKIKHKAMLVFSVLSLVPLALTGSVAYKIAEEVVKKNVGLNFTARSQETMEKIDRSLYEVYHNVQTWGNLELMQDIVTNDLDGKIAVFLMGLSKEYGFFSSIEALNLEGKVVASSKPELIGRNLKEKNYFKGALARSISLKDVSFDDADKEWVVTFSFPVMAKFEQNKPIGILCAKWKAGELFSVAQRREEGNRLQGYGYTLLLRSDGLIISAPESRKWEIFQRNLLKSGLKAVGEVSQKKEGYLIEKDDRNKESLIGYSYSKGYRDFPGLGWLVLVIEDTKTVFEPIKQIKTGIFIIGLIMMFVAVILSLAVSREMARPILKISQFAAKVSRGDFEGKIEYAQRDEIGDLAASFNKMTGDLKKIQSQLVQSAKMASIGQLAAGMAHEINNPVSVILGFSQSVAKNIKEDDPLYLPLKSIEREAVRCKKLVGDLLAFSRLGKSQTDMISINTTIDETLSLIEPEAKTRNIEITRDYDATLPGMVANKNQLQQVIMNLCNNAMDAMPEGGRLKVSTRQASIPGNSQDAPDKKSVTIIVSDTGQGIPKEVIDRIFEPFFTTKEVGKGTGLGLSLCYEIIQKHRGTIEVESEVGQGTSFFVKLPLSQ